MRHGREYANYEQKWYEKLGDALKAVWDEIPKMRRCNGSSVRIDFNVPVGFIEIVGDIRQASKIMYRNNTEVFRHALYIGLMEVYTVLVPDDTKENPSQILRALSHATKLLTESTNKELLMDEVDGACEAYIKGTVSKKTFDDCIAQIIGELNGECKKFVKEYFESEAMSSTKIAAYRSKSRQQKYRDTHRPEESKAHWREGGPDVMESSIEKDIETIRSKNASIQ